MASRFTMNGSSRKWHVSIAEWRNRMTKKETCIICDGVGETVADKSYDGDLFSLEGEVVQCENCEGKGIIE